MNRIAYPKVWIFNILSALSSAALLSLVHANPDFWFVSLFALIPFLWRLCHVGRVGSIATGIMLATFFAFITGLTELSVDPAYFIFRMVSLNAAFIVFTLGVDRVKRSFGFDPLAIALIWFPIEYILISFANLGGVFSISQPGSKIVVEFCSLFGLVLVSLIVVLVNALILWFLEYARERIRPTYNVAKKKPKKHYPQFSQVVIEKYLNFLSGPRAPPPHYGFQNY